MNRQLISMRYFIALTVVFVALIIVLPANHITQQTYHISSLQYHLLLLAVEMPIIIAWIASYFGYRQLQHYSRLIKTSPEGQDFTAMTKGLRWMAWGIAIPSTISLILNAIANHNHGFLMYALIITNYMYVAVSLVTFNHISRGSYQLARRSDVPMSLRSFRVLILGFVALGVLFCYLISRHLHLDYITNSYNVFYLPNWLLGISLVVPYLYAWFSGLFGSYQLIATARSVTGILYKQALQLMAAGIVILIFALTAQQYYRSVIPRTGHLAVSATIIWIYVVYTISIVGSLLLIAGARRLQKIEEV